MTEDAKLKWAIFRICESIQRVSGTKFTRKDAMRQVEKELKLFGHDLSVTPGKGRATDFRFLNWITRFHVSHRFKVMMNMGGVSEFKNYKQ